MLQKIHVTYVKQLSNASHEYYRIKTEPQNEKKLGLVFSLVHEKILKYNSYHCTFMNCFI